MSSNQYPLRLPLSLMNEVRKCAKEDRASVNQFLVTAIAEKISALRTATLLKKRAQAADEHLFLEALDHVGNQDPIHPEDRIN